eukprot:6182724-Pleurochrysis_carterae.AAC.3
MAEKPIGRTPAHDSKLPVKRYHADSFGVSRDGRRAATSADDIVRYHQNDIGNFDVASLARMSLAIVCH